MLYLVPKCLFLSSSHPSHTLYLILKILREGNSLSQIHSLFFCIFLKMVLERVGPALPIHIRQRNCHPVTVRSLLLPEFRLLMLGNISLFSSLNFSKTPYFITLANKSKVAS